MSVSFRTGRYLVALLWSWSLPAFIGAVVGFLLATWQVLEVLKTSDELIFDALDASITRVTESCAIPPDPPDLLSPPVSVTGQRLNPGQPTHSPPVAGAGGETG